MELAQFAAIKASIDRFVKISRLMLSLPFKEEQCLDVPIHINKILLELTRAEQFLVVTALRTILLDIRDKQIAFLRDQDLSEAACEHLDKQNPTAPKMPKTSDS